MPTLPDYSLADPAVFAFVLIPITLVLLLLAGVAKAWRRAGADRPSTSRALISTLGGSAIWMTATWLAADSGLLLDWTRTPPPFVLLMAATLAIALFVALGPIGQRFARHLPLAALVGVQAFRLPLELAMHRMYERGIMPGQMSYSGRNFDIVTGATAVVVAVLLSRGVVGRRVVAVWNIVGLTLLVNVVIVALISTPRLQYFGPDRVNIWVMLPPFIWLPSVMVLAALAGHLMVWRASRAGT